MLSRRQAVAAGGTGVAAASLAGCGLFSTEPSGRSTPHRAAGRQGKESPVLAAEVEAGRLPALPDRLPDKPLVVDPVQRPGSYGGTWRTALLGAADTPWLGRTTMDEDLTRWNRTATDVVPNVAESFDASPDARVFTIRLRRGIRWSDGKPFTAADVAFSYQDVLQNADLTPVFPTTFTSGGKPGRLEKVDDHTVRLAFDKPNATLPTQIAYLGSGLIQPRHYLTRFHLKYNPDAKHEAKKEGYDSWVALFLAKADVTGNTDLPRLYGWVLTQGLGTGSKVVVERNPYYWKVDSHGRQLPYIDKVVYDIISDPQTMLLKATNGEFDFQTRTINTLSNKPVLARNRDKGDYHFVTLDNSYQNDMYIGLNLNHGDPKLRAIFQKRDFRIGLSYAIDRREMSDAVWQRVGRPWQAAPLPNSKFYDEQMAHQYLDHDVAEANRHLDRAGLSGRDRDGFRLRPDGKRLSFQVEVASPALIPFWSDGMQLVVEYWRKVGLDVHIKTEDRALYEERQAANKHDAYVWTGPGGFRDETLKTYCWFPSNTAGQAWAGLWAQWFLSQGASGEKPPPAPRRQMELYWQLLGEPSEAKRDSLFRQILDIAKEQFWVIGTVQNPVDYGIAKNSFRNVPKSIPDSDTFHTPALTNPEQYFIE